MLCENVIEIRCLECFVDWTHLFLMPGNGMSFNFLSDCILCGLFQKSAEESALLKRKADGHNDNGQSGKRGNTYIFICQLRCLLICVVWSSGRMSDGFEVSLV